MSVNDFDVLAYYRDLWKTKSEKRNAIWQGTISNDGCMENCIKLRINAAKIRLLQMRTETNSSSLLTLKC